MLKIVYIFGWFKGPWFLYVFLLSSVMVIPLAYTTTDNYNKANINLIVQICWDSVLVKGS